MTSSVFASPTFDAFGPFPDADFGGTGIPNDSVAASSQFVADFSTEAGNQSALITVALTATPRFANPSLTNDGFGTFTATTGSNFGNPNDLSDQTNSSILGATWNFNFFAEAEGINGSTPSIEDFEFDLLFDLDPGDDTSVTDRGIIDLDSSVAAFDPGAAIVQGSQNALFGFLGTGVPGIVTPPAVTSFDTDALGEYSFAIQVTSLLDGTSLETVSIDVLVVPEPGSFLLAGIGSLALLKRRRD